jgi:hypothetical protein
MRICIVCLETKVPTPITATRHNHQEKLCPADACTIYSLFENKVPNKLINSASQVHLG